MKILHTSDWHLGQSLFNYDRTEEQSAMLEQMVCLVREHQPDVFLLSGDIFDTTQPSAATQRLFVNAIVNIHETRPGMAIVCTAGNHDSASRHEVFRQPWLNLNVHSIGRLDRDNPSGHIIRIEGTGYVVALPYCYERNIPQDFCQQLLDEVARENKAQLPVVMMAHTTLERSDLRGHMTHAGITIGGIETMTLEQVGRGYDYLALGHIHHAQWVRGTSQRARYCGSPLQVSFDEDYEHSVSIVDIDAHHGKPLLHTIPIHSPRPLVTLPPQGYASWEKAMQMLADFPQDNPAYIRLNISHESTLPPDATNEASRAVQAKQCRLCIINRERREAGTGTQETFSIQEFRQESPLEIACMYARQHGYVFDKDTIKLFNQAVNLVNEE